VTRARIAELLELVVLELANNLPPAEVLFQGTTGPDDNARIRAEWAYVKGLASHPVLLLRDRLRGAE
jgi:hypothetical protein